MIMLFPFFAACSNTPGGEPLTAPTLTLDNSSVRWSVVDGADGYNVYINGKLRTTVTVYRYSLAILKAGIYTVGVTAKNGDKESEMSNTVTYTKRQSAEDTTEKAAVNFVSDASYNYDGFMSKVENTVLTRQIKDRRLWADFVEQFRSNVDEPPRDDLTNPNAGGWRGEFWGKLMMGAVMFYEQTQDEELYAILEETVRDILTTQDDDGRISTYGRLSDGGIEFDHWDVWCRKHVLLGMESFYDICKDTELKQTLISSMLAQMDYILKYVGDGEGKMSILSTGRAMGGMASASILEAIVRLYELTGEQRVLDFATHVVESGGSSNADLIEAALAGEKYPYQWGAPKGYEFCSYFKGVLDYYLLTGVEKYKTAGINAAYAVLKSEITVTGGAGYNSEEFNYSVCEQANPSNSKGNLETCVAVAVTQLFSNAYRITGDTAFIDSLEKTMYNALYGAMDKEGCYDHAFTSYFNLMFSTKSSSAGGGLYLPTVNRSYGCCIAFGAYGMGLMHRIHYNTDKAAIYANFYLEGAVTLNSPGGKPITFVTETNYPTTGTVKITVHTAEPQAFALKMRIPSWSGETTVSINGAGLGNVVAGEYYPISREWKDGDIIVLSFDMRATLYRGSAECSNPDAQYNVAVLRGPLVLARDRRLGEELFQTVDFAVDGEGYLDIAASHTATFGTLCEFAVKLKDGSRIHMVDYASAGGTYNENSLMTVFMPTTDYWNVTADLSKGVYLVSTHGNTVIGAEEGMFSSVGFLADHKDLSALKLTFTDRGNGLYTIGKSGSSSVMTCVLQDGDWKLAERAYTGADSQLFSLDRSSLFTYKVVSKMNGQLLSLDSVSTLLHLYTDVGSPMQKWQLIPAESEENL